MTSHSTLSSVTTEISPSEDTPPPPYIPPPSRAAQLLDEANKQNKRRRSQQWVWAWSEYDRAEKKKVVQLTSKLRERLRPYVESEYAGDPDDPATVAFINNVKGEAENLKKEQFGVEVSHSDII
jgi:hypothetical protein